MYSLSGMSKWGNCIYIYNSSCITPSTFRLPTPFYVWVWMYTGYWNLPESANQINCWSIRNQSKCQFYAYTGNVLPSLCLMRLWREYIHCWCFSHPLLWNATVCTLYYQYQVACPRNQTDQIHYAHCHAQWGCSVAWFWSENHTE